MTSGLFWEKAWKYRIEEGRKFPTPVTLRSMESYENGVRNGVLHCDGILMDAIADLEAMLAEAKKMEELSFMNTGSGLWTDNSKVTLNIYIKWRNKWFGEKDESTNPQ